MKTTSLALFAALVLFGWTSLAAGALAVLFADPAFSSRPHQHQVAPVPEPEQAPLKSAPLSFHPDDETGGLL